MYRLKYAEVIEDDQTEARERERMALTRSIELMVAAEEDGATPADKAMAILFTTNLWTTLIEDLAEPDNMLPKALRAQIISIGIWILRELESIRNDAPHGFEDLKAVSVSIRDGLL